MDTLYIRQFTARYHLRKSTRDERERLDKILRTVLDDMLEQALQHVGVPIEEEVCIRQLTIPVRLHLSAADSALVRTWGLTVAETLKRAADGPLSSDLVRYGSRAHALIDLAASIARGNYQRAWAWKQLGIWHTGERPSDGEAVRELVHALCTESQLLLPVFRALADQQLLSLLASRLSADQWLRLTQAALSATGTAFSLLDSDESTGSVSSVVRQEAHRLIQASPLAEALTAIVAASPEIARAMAILILLATDPSVLRTPAEKSRTLVNTVTEALGISAVVAEQYAEVSQQTSTTPALSSTSSSADESPIPAVRRRAQTRFGGLLFLLGIMEDLGLPDEICAQFGLSNRLPRWIFHQLALALVPAEVDDPAVLAFAGLLPDAPPPSIDEYPPDAEEKRMIAVFAARIREAVGGRLNRKDQQAVIHFLCQRRAEIVADPGWLEVRFPLAEVSIDIRRAGLDLNPDYVPWLGIVVKFIYE